MSGPFGIIVTDASPLITLAAAGALDLLTLPGLPVRIPDMVYWEVTQDLARLGATVVVDWARASRGLVTIEPTAVFTEFQALRLLDATTPSKGRGERAAVEVLTDAIERDEGLTALMLFEDADVMRRKIAELLPERAVRMSTGVYLRELEAAGRIQSADQVLDQALAKGRDIARQRIDLASPDAMGPLSDQLRHPRSRDR